MSFRYFHQLRNAFRIFMNTPRHSVVTRYRYKYPPLQFPVSTGFICALWPFSKSEELTLNEKMAELLQTATTQIKGKKYSEADENLHRILQLLADAHQNNEITSEELAGSRARVFREMAKLNLRQQNYKDAEKLLVETIRSSMSSGMDSEDACIIELSLKLAILYLQLGDIPKASSGFEYCFNAQIKKTESIFQSPGTKLSDDQANEIALLGLVANAYAHFLIQKGELPAAKEKLESALKSAQLVYPPYHENILHLHCDLINIESRLGHSDKALEHLKSVIIAAEAENSHPTLPLIRLFCTGAMIDGNRGEFQHASSWLDKATESAKKISPKMIQEAALKEIQSVRDTLDSWQEDEKKAASDSEIEK